MKGVFAPAAGLHSPEGMGGSTVRVSARLIILFGLPAGVAFGHGGDGIDHSVTVSNQLPATIADTGGGGDGGGGGFSSAIGGSINSSVSGGGGTVANGGVGEGGPGSEIVDLGPSGPPPLAQPNTVPNDTVRDVPRKDEGTSRTYSLERDGALLPRSRDSAAWYQRALSDDRNKVNQWLDSLRP